MNILIHYLFNRIKLELIAGKHLQQSYSTQRHLFNNGTNIKL